MFCDTMRPETGSTSRTSPSSHTSPFSPNANCLSPNASSTNRLSRRMSWSDLNHHSDFHGIFHPYWCLLYLPPVQQMWLLPPPIKCPAQGNHGMLAVATTIIPPYADAGRLRDCPTTLEVPEDLADCPGPTSQGTTGKMGMDPASLPTDACTAPHQAIASPAVPPTPPTIILPAAPPLTGSTNLVAGIPPSDAIRTVQKSSLWQLTVLRPPLTTRKAPCWLREPLMDKSPSIPTWCYWLKLAQDPWLWRLTQVHKSAPSPWVSIRSFSPINSPRPGTPNLAPLSLQPISESHTKVPLSPS